MSQEPELFEFEGFVLDPARRLLIREGETVSLPPKAVATLLVLVERHGQVVDKEELLEKVWPDTFITEATLTQNVFRLRKALGEEAGEHRFIVTVPGRGYSFVADLRPMAPPPPAPARAIPPAPPPREEPPAPAAAEAPAPPAEPATALPEPRDLAGTFPTAPSAAVAAPPPYLQRRRSLIAAMAMGLIGLLAALFFLLPDSPAPAPPSAPSAARDTALVPRRSIAVLGFRNLSGRQETAWLSIALSEMFTVELGVGEKLHTITGESVTQAKRDLGLSDPENLSADTLARVRGLLGCDVVLLGSYLALGKDANGRIRVDLRLQDTATGETLSVLTGTRTEADLFELVSDLGRDLRQRLGTGAPTRAEAASTRAAFPSSPEAGRLYSEGLKHLRSLDTLAARDLLQRATEAEPAFPLAHAALASAWSTLGYDENAAREAARALDLSTTLPREDRLLVDALHAENSKEWAKAVDIYDSLWRFFPDDLEHGLRLARAEIAAGRPKRALATISTLRRLPAPLADDPRIDLAEAEAAAALSDYVRQETAAARAVEKGRQLGARLLTAQALQLQGHALRSLGRQEEALTYITEAESIFSAAGDRVGVGRAAHDSANLLRDRGDSEGAGRQYERALAIHREAGNQRGILRALTNIGGLELQKGNYDRAQQVLQEVVETAREVNDTLGEGRGLASLGSGLKEQGDLEGAQRSFEEALGRFRAIGLVLGEAGVHTSLAGIYLDLGKLREARAESETAVRLSRQISHTRSLGSALMQMGHVLLEEGRLDQAQKAFVEMEDLARRTGHKLLLADAKAGQAQVQRLRGELAGSRQNIREALALWEEADERQQSTAGHRVLARLELDQGKMADAEREARATAEQSRGLGLPDGEALSREILAEIYLTRGLTQGDTAAAEREIRQAQELTRNSQSRRVRLTVAITAARVTGVRGQAAEARQALAALRDEALMLGFRMAALDASIALAELEIRKGNPQAGQAALRRLQGDASRQGYRLAAVRAQSLLATSPRRP